MRQLLAVAVGAAAAAAGALILGEYELVGIVPLVAAFLLVAGGMAWGVWISTGRDLEFATAAAWTGVGLGGVAAPLWLRGAVRRGGRSSPGS